MKIYILGNNKNNTNSLATKLSELLDIKKFNLDEENDQLKKINKIIIENKDWIIESKYDDNSNIVASNSTTIIYLNINKKTLFNDKNQNKQDNMNNFIMKYSNKIIIIKSENEIKKLIQAIYKGIEL